MNQLIESLKNKLKATLIETHISWVLVDEVVYKIKKPVNFGFLDFTTLEKRKFFCEKEVDLNKRLCEDLYLGVFEISYNGMNYSIGTKGKAVEYCVAMKKLPQEKMMDVLLENHKLTLEDIDKLALLISDFHKNSETNTTIKNFGTKDSIAININENFEQTAQCNFLTKHQFEALRSYSEDFLNEYNFEKRIKEDKIRDCHGDLYSKNICILDKIYIYDCIEFNDRFRYSDVASDVAFLIMDLEHYNRFDLARTFLDKYLEYSNDKSLIEILGFYKIYRAYVRGKITYFDNKKREAESYFNLAYSYLPNKYKPKAIAMVGLTGCGKSYFANHLKEELLAVVFSSDLIRKELFPAEKDEFGKGYYASSYTETVYEKLSLLAYETLREGKNVILDATFIKQNYRQNLIDKLRKLGINPFFVYLDIEDKMIIENLRKRENEKSISDGTIKIYYEQKKVLEKPQEAIVIHSSNKQNINKVLEKLEVHI